MREIKFILHFRLVKITNRSIILYMSAPAIYNIG